MSSGPLFPTMTHASIDRQSVVLDGCRVSYRVRAPEGAAGDDPGGGAADGPPLVLLHGGGLDSAALTWRHALPALGRATGRAVYAPDWPGYGESDPPTRSPSTATYAAVLEAFLDALDLERVALVGISMGGGVALGVALDSPDRVDRLVAVDSYGLGGTVPGGPLGALAVRLRLAGLSWGLLRRSRLATRLAVRAITGPGTVSTPLVDDVRRALDRSDAGRAFESFQRSEVGVGGLATNYLDRLSALSVPALFVHGERDPLVPVAWAVRAAVLAPEAELRVLGGCGHWPPREAPERFLDAVEPFLGA
jgi:pimeloyl-ACP methyl ester carboxylesterase